MNDSTQPEIPDFAALAADPEIAPLLNFTPVVRKVKRPDGWTDELQRELIARIAATGTLHEAVTQMGKHATGAENLYKTHAADSFRASWDAAIIIGRRRNGLDARPPFAGEVPGVTRRGKLKESSSGPLPGQIRNEFGEWEDEESVANRVEEAKDSITAKLLRCRRLYLQEISVSAGKRAAFEILTQYPIDWDKAARLEPQVDEPWNRANQRQPDMILTAENGWSFGEWGYGEDRKAKMQAEVDRYREEEGLPPVDWESESAEPNATGSEADTSRSARDACPDRPAGRPASSGANPSDGEAGFTPAKQPSRKPEDKPGPRLRKL